VTYTVTFEEPAKALQVEFFAKKRHRELKEVAVQEEFDLVARVHNPNDDSVTGTLNFNPGGLFFHVGGIEYGSHFRTCSRRLYLQKCPFNLPAGETGSIHPRPDVQADGQQDPDLQSVTSAQIDLKLRVVR
jgi:hypothetical protein